MDLAKQEVFGNLIFKKIYFEESQSLCFPNIYYSYNLPIDGLEQWR